MHPTNLKKVLTYLELKHYGRFQKIYAVNLWFNKLKEELEILV